MIRELRLKRNRAVGFKKMGRQRTKDVIKGNERRQWWKMVTKARGARNCGAEERNKKLQGCCVDVGDVEVVCYMKNSSPGNKEKDPEGWKRG